MEEREAGLYYLFVRKTVKTPIWNFKYLFIYRVLLCTCTAKYFECHWFSISKHALTYGQICATYTINCVFMGQINTLGYRILSRFYPQWFRIFNTSISHEYYVRVAFAVSIGYQTRIQGGGSCNNVEPLNSDLFSNIHILLWVSKCSYSKAFILHSQTPKNVANIQIMHLTSCKHGRRKCMCRFTECPSRWYNRWWHNY